MDVKVSHDGEGRYIVSCPDQIEWRAREELLAAVIQATEGAVVNGIILDLDGVHFISSAGLGGIFSLRRHVLGQGARIVAARPGAGVRRLLRTVNMEALMPVAPSMAEARSRLGKPTGRDAA